jgi:probable F420-dependent oxidoreductase
LADHIVIPRRVQSSYPYAADGASPFDPEQPFYEPLSVLNFLAGCTERIRLGTHVLIVPYRPPVFAAKILATLDALSGGRLIVGAGVGWMSEEFEALGLSTYAQRGAVTDEYLQLFKELWTKNDPEFHGTFVEVSDIGFHPKPVQRPYPPIWIGGHSIPALRRVALLGDGWMPIGLVTISFTAPVVVTKTSSSPRPLLQGRPDEVAADLGKYRAVGVQNFNINLPSFDIGGQAEAMEQFAREVVPLLSD